ncbi:MAG: hypothetical protein C4527_02050 [Candidatus Omnitrophota bacterium]|jgi:hypothetical protein|nr:MAG: hypothetical protein C4527_02050 [Candidatus Omnitrophota bacterium]
MKISLYFDEDSMDKHLVRALRARNIKVNTALDAGMIQRADEEHLNYASSQNHVLFSFNVGDFYRLHSEFMKHEKPHAGIILAQQQRYSIGILLRNLLKLIATISADEMKNRIEFINRWK